MESVLERQERLHTADQIEAFRQKTLLSYESKVRYAITRVRLYEEECGKRGLNTHVSVGGLDSITLLVFIRRVCDVDAPAARSALWKIRRYRQSTDNSALRR